MHVLLATDHYPPHTNGHAVAVAWWAQALVEAGLRVTVVAAGRGPAKPLLDHASYRELWLPTRGIGREGHPLSALAARASRLRELEGDAPDLLHLHGYGPLCALVERRFPHVTKVATIHQFPEGSGAPDWPPVRAVMRWQLRRVFSRAALASAPSACAAARLSELTGDRDVRVIPTGVDPVFESAGPVERTAPAEATAPAERATPAKRTGPVERATPAEAGARSRPLQVLYVGRRSPDKRFGTVVELARRHPEARWSALGSGRLSEAGWPESLRVLPQAGPAGVAAAMREADVLIAPSVNETQGLAALEALFVGTPVAAPRGSAQAELIQEGVNGALYRPDSLEEAWQALQLAAALPRTGSRESVAPWRREALVRRMLETYAEVGGRPTSRGPRRGP